MLTAVPALRAVRRALPDHEVVLAASAAFADLVVGPDLVERVLPTAELAPVPWSGPAPDVAVNLHGCGPDTHRLLLDLGPSRLVAFGCPAAGVSGPEWRRGEHEVRRWCRLLDEVGWPANPAELHLPAPRVASPAPGAVIVHPGAASASRRWPVERFAAVATWVREQGHQVVVTGSSEEGDLARKVARRSGLPRDAVLAGRTDVPTLSALVAQARLVLCGDTGTAHLASAHRTPSIVLFGPVPPSEWGPPSTGPHTVLWHGAARAAEGGRGDPHGAAVDPALLDTSVEEVIDAVARRLAEARRLGDAAPAHPRQAPCRPQSQSVR